MLNATPRVTEVEFKSPRNVMLSTFKASQLGLSMARYIALLPLVNTFYQESASTNHMWTTGCAEFRFLGFQSA